MASIYYGEEKKFSIELTAQGFSMDTDDFEIEVSVPKGSVKGYKNPPAGTNPDLLVFKESDTWYGIIDTSKLPAFSAEMKVIATALVPDANANDGIRREMAVAKLGQLTLL